MNDIFLLNVKPETLVNDPSYIFHLLKIFIVRELPTRKTIYFFDQFHLFVWVACKQVERIAQCLETCTQEMLVSHFPLLCFVALINSESNLGFRVVT